MMKRIFAGLFAIGLLAAALIPPASAQTQSVARIVGSGGTPVLTSCGTTPAIVGTDLAGTVTMGATATGCVITFSQAYAAAPHCTVTWIATPLASQSYATSTTAITLTQTSTSNNVVKYVCIGQN